MSKKSILVLGQQGQLAQALQNLLNPAEVTFSSRTEADFTDPQQVLKYVEHLNPDIIINASAYTAVDKAELEPEIADLVNHKTPEILAQWVATHNKSLVHYSTDYVFNGSGSDPRTEEALTEPLNIYGHSKLAGDKAILKSGAKALIIRTSWVYSHIGHNFFQTMLRLGAERDELSIVNDQVGSPTYAPELAAMTIKMLNHSHFKNQKGAQIYNVCGASYGSWYEFATEIFRLAPEFDLSLKIKSIKPILSADYSTPAKRPLNSRLNQMKLKMDFSLEMPEWKTSLRKAFENLPH